MGAIPNFTVNAPQIANPLDQAAKVMNLRMLMGQQQMLPYQMQQQQAAAESAQTEAAMKQLQLKTVQGVNAYWSNPDKFQPTDEENGAHYVTTGGAKVQPDAMATMLGVQPGDPVLTQIRGMMKAGVPFPGAIAEAQNTLNFRMGVYALNEEQQKVINTGLTTAKGLMAPILAEKDPVKKQALFADALPGLAQALAFDPGSTQALQAVQQGALGVDALANRLGAESDAMDFAKKAAEKARTETEQQVAAQKVINPQAGVSPEQVAEVNKERLEQPLKIQQTREQARATTEVHQMLEGMTKPVYAYNPQTGQKTLMSQTDALNSGIRLMTPVTEKEVGEDTQLINRLGDVRQKIAEYQQNLSKIGTSVSQLDQNNIAALIGHGKIKVGAFGSELPMDRLNSVLDQENIKNLSSDAKKLLVSYYNARESMQGYQRVLSGTGRANEKAMELNLDALPNPGTTDPEYAQESMQAFRQNLAVVGQGLPTIPGVKSPEEIEQEVLGQPKPSAKPQKATKASKYGVAF